MGMRILTIPIMIYIILFSQGCATINPQKYCAKVEYKPALTEDEMWICRKLRFWE